MRRVFAERLATLMAERKLQQNQLAIDAGISESNLSRLLNGSTLPKYTTIISIAKALRVPPAVFFDNSIGSPHYIMNPNDIIIQTDRILELNYMDDTHTLLTVYALNDIDIVRELPESISTNADIQTLSHILKGKCIIDGNHYKAGNSYFIPSLAGIKKGTVFNGSVIKSGMSGPGIVYLNDLLKQLYLDYVRKITPFTNRVQLEKMEYLLQK